MERGAATQPLWQGVSLVVDEFTRAAYGEIIVHAVLLANFAITRKAQWFKNQTPARLTKTSHGRTARACSGRSPRIRNRAAARSVS